MSRTHQLPLAADARVVFLVNFLSPNLLNVFREVEKRVGHLTILASVPIESNRNWNLSDSNLNLIVQRTYTKRRIVQHPGGYQEELYVHFPVDTFSQLRRLGPDCIVSLEMGSRSAMCSLFRHCWNRNTRHVLSVYGSERSEAGRGRLRLWLRRRLLRAADVITYNGPSCYHYLLSQGADAERMTPWNYAADPQKPYRGELVPYSSQPLKILTVGQLVSRKGILPAAEQLNAWAMKHPSLRIEWALAGLGELYDSLANKKFSSNLNLTLLGHRDSDQLKDLYRDYPIALFPTLGDEWGLVVDEALASGQVFIGSIYSQAVEVLIQPGVNGWSYDPESQGSLAAALDQLVQATPSQLEQMRQQARMSVQNRTHVEAAEQFVTAVQKALK